MKTRDISRRKFFGSTTGGLGILSMNSESFRKTFPEWYPFDSHVHLPSLSGKTYIWHDVLSLLPDSRSFFEYLNRCGIEKILGQGTPDVQSSSNIPKLVTSANDASLFWRDKYPEFIVPACNANPDFLELSIKEMERMHKEGVAWLGEMLGYMFNYKYITPEFYKIVEAASDLNYIISIHANNEEMEKLLEDFPKVTWNLCHFTNSKKGMVERFEIGAKHPNMLLDTSGSGIERMGMLELAVEKMSADRIIFGSDFPINDPGQSLSRIGNAFLSQKGKNKVMRSNLIRVLKEHGAQL
ncbi:amidohydrolase family protein [candidate division KSB1 bacterium]